MDIDFGVFNDTTKVHMHRPVPILSIDGGGMRGIIPCKVLQKIEELTEKSITEQFQLMAGSSTGALISLGLNVPSDEDPAKPKYTANEMFDYYCEYGKSIFSQSFSQRIWSLLYPRYDSAGLEQLLRSHSGDPKMNQALTRVMVTSYDVFHHKPRIFTNHNKDEPDLTMAAAVLRSTAAPTYFSPQPGPNEENYIDGGIVANNPAQLAHKAAMQIFCRPDNFLICSLGTGDTVPHISYSQSKEWGVVQWADKGRILDLLINSQAAEVDRFMEELYPQEGEERRYFRFQKKIDEKSAPLDDPSDANIRRLEEIGDELLEENQEELRIFVRKLELATIPEEHAVPL